MMNCDKLISNDCKDHKLDYMAIHNNTKNNNVEKSQKINDLETTVSQLQFSLNESQKFEYELRIALANQVERTNELQEQLNNEKNRNSKILEVLKDDSYSESSSPRCGSAPPSAFNDAKSSFGTVSSVLMQYKYDELTLSYRRSMKNLTNKDRQIKILLNDNDGLRKELENFKRKYRYVEERTESLCCKYLNLQKRRDDEIYRLNISLNYINQMCDYLKKTRENDLKELLTHFNENDKNIELIKQIKQYDELILKNLILESKIEFLKTGMPS